MRWLPGLMLLFLVAFFVGCQSSGGVAGVASMPMRVDGTMMVSGLSCPLCAHNVDASLSKVPGVAAVKTNLSTGQVELQFEDGKSPDPAALDHAVADAGFTVAESLTGVPQPAQSQATGHEGHDMSAGSMAMVSDPNDPIIKGYGVRVPVHQAEGVKSASQLRKQLGKLPGVETVNVEDEVATLWFDPDACLTENQVKNAVKLVGYTPGDITTITEPRP